MDYHVQLLQIQHTRIIADNDYVFKVCTPEYLTSDDNFAVATKQINVGKKIAYTFLLYAHVCTCCQDLTPYNYILLCRCWLSEEKGTIWAFVAPMLLIILVGPFLSLQWWYCDIMCSIILLSY